MGVLFEFGVIKREDEYRVEEKERIYLGFLGFWFGDFSEVSSIMGKKEIVCLGEVKWGIFS